MKFAIKKAEKFGWKGVKGWNIDFNKIASISYIEIKTDIPTRKNTLNDRVYFVVKGKADFYKAGKKYPIGEKEAIFIPKNTKYSYSPKGTTIICEANIPLFSQEDEIVFK